MSDGISINVDDEFSNGSLNEKFFVDMPHMNDEQLAALAKFMAHVSQGLPLPGKNKQSWLDDNLDEIPGTASYKEGKYWHYHCGPRYTTNPPTAMTFNLGLNLNGFTSGEVIHYIKHSSTEISIVGYSPCHTPFPKSDSTSYSNPLFSSED